MMEIQKIMMDAHHNVKLKTVGNVKEVQQLNLINAVHLKRLLKKRQ